MKEIIMACIVLFLVVIIGVSIYKNNQVPSGLGVENNKLAKLPSSPNAVSSQTVVEDKYVEPLDFKSDLSTSYQRVLEIIEEEPLFKVFNRESDYIHVVASTETINFKYDIEFYFDQEAQVIHYRSASRIGYSDFDKNRATYIDIKQRYDNSK